MADDFAKVEGGDSLVISESADDDCNNRRRYEIKSRNTLALSIHTSSACSPWGFDTRTTKNKQYKKSHKTDNRARDVDQIQDDLKKEIPLSFEINDELPG